MVGISSSDDINGETNAWILTNTHPNVMRVDQIVAFFAKTAEKPIHGRRVNTPDVT